MAFGLEGIKVVQTATIIAGPTAGRFLADWGADVITVENPRGGDELRGNRQTASKRSRPVAVIQSDINYGALNQNRNKRGMTLDLSQESGREVIYKMLAKADVFLTNFLPSDLKKFKLEYETLSRLNPRLIQANLTGYGKKGPERDTAAADYTGFWARSGALRMFLKPGITPLLTPGGVGDRTSGLLLALGIMTALYVRERTGVGQEVDVSLFQSGVFVISDDIAGALATGQDLRPFDRKDSLNVMATFYQTKDGKWLRLGVSQPDLYWSRFCRVIERTELEHDPRFESFESKMKNHAVLFNILQEVFLSRTLEEWRVRLNEAGLRWAPLQSLPEVIADPQARANDFFVAYDHPTYGRLELVANPIKLSKTPEMIRMPAPEFGQHTEEVLLEYGYTWQDIERFKEQGVIA
ncbi:MAG: CoA transferase [Chloroflexi bacterium]|nr:CoA transferase [Chloroflexota bacterium]